MPSGVRYQFLSFAAAVVFGVLAWQPARAVPSFARQTGLQCSACHTAYPALNSFGREFKMRGYTLGDAKTRFPHVAAVLQPSFTRTSKKQPGGAAAGFKGNDNLALSQASIFYGGRIVGNLGAFSQVTYNGVSDRLGIDNTDVRYADTTTLAGDQLLYGFTLNNSPTVQDPWNTLPAWGYPFASSDLAPSPAASTMIDGGLAQQVLGFGGYVRWNNLVYGELTGYRTLSQKAQTALGVSPMGEAQIDGIAPYWRFAVQKTFGSNYISLGTFGLAANTYPGRDKSMGSDRRVDAGIDSEYQYSFSPHDISAYFRWIHERASWSASQALGDASNAHDTLDDVSLTGSYLYDLTYGADLQLDSITGGSDSALYGSRTGSPDTQSVTFQLSWLPFNKDGGPSFWPWFNPKFALQYKKYFQYDGAVNNYDGNGRNASDNDTLYLMMWAPI